MHMYIIENSLKNTVIGVDLLVLHFTNRDIIFFFHFLLLQAAYTGLCCFIKTTVLFWGRREWTTGKQQIVECQ